MLKEIALFMSTTSVVQFVSFCASAYLVPAIRKNGENVDSNKENVYLAERLGASFILAFICGIIAYKSCTATTKQPEQETPAPIIKVQSHTPAFDPSILQKQRGK